MQQSEHLEIKKQLEEIISVMEKQVETARANKQRLDSLIEKQKETVISDTIVADIKKTLQNSQELPNFNSQVEPRSSEEALQDVSLSMEEMTLEEYESSSSTPKSSGSRLKLVVVIASLSFLLIGSIAYNM